MAKSTPLTAVFLLTCTRYELSEAELEGFYNNVSQEKRAIKLKLINYKLKTSYVSLGIYCKQNKNLNVLIMVV